MIELELTRLNYTPVVTVKWNSNVTSRFVAKKMTIVGIRIFRLSDV